MRLLHMTARRGAVVGALLLCLALVSLAACSDSTSTQGSATRTPGATGGGGGSASCASALPGGGSASAGSSFPDLPLPPNSTSAGPTKVMGGGDGQFTLWTLDVCSTGTNAGAVSAFFASLPSSGWQKSNWFPLDAETETACGNVACWAKDTRYTRLEQVNDQNGVTLAHLRLATPPLAPACTDPAGEPYSSGYEYFLFPPDKPAFPGLTTGFDHIALPPLTKTSEDAAAGNRYVALCSAGSPAMVKAFMDKHLQAVGWVAQGNYQYKYDNTYQLDILDGQNPQVKAVLHYPDPHVYA